MVTPMPNCNRNETSKSIMLFAAVFQFQLLSVLKAINKFGSWIIMRQDSHIVTYQPHTLSLTEVGLCRS